MYLPAGTHHHFAVTIPNFVAVVYTEKYPFFQLENALHHSSSIDNVCQALLLQAPKHGIVRMS